MDDTKEEAGMAIKLEVEAVAREAGISTIVDAGRIQGQQNRDLLKFNMTLQGRHRATRK
jgi:hypothetical protein